MLLIQILLAIIALPVIAQIILVIVAMRRELSQREPVRIHRTPKQVTPPTQQPPRYKAFVCAVVAIGLLVAYYN
jgi:hypothetical protein